MISRQAALEHKQEKVVYRPKRGKPEVGEIVGLGGDPNRIWVRYGANPKAQLVKLEDLEWLEPH